MSTFIKYLCFLIIANTHVLFSQQNNSFNRDSDTFIIKGSVTKSDTGDPIQFVNIEITGSAYTTTDVYGEFKIKAKIGDELIISHKDFQTVYHIIQGKDRIQVKVEPSDDETQNNYESVSRIPKFNVLIDSAKTYLKKDAKKSIQFIGDAIPESTSTKQNAEAYELLGDIYMHWKQYDLAVSNYRISLQSNNNNVVKLKLAKAYQLNKNYQESIQTYKSITKKGLSNWQLVNLYEGLGDTYQYIKSYKSSIDSYGKGLTIAEKHLITPKVTDLNSKLAEVYNASGKKDKAKNLFNNSLKLAKQENKKRSVLEQVKVADFENENNDYSNEIALRKKALNTISEIETDSAFSNESPLTAQKQNYKIGNAYALQKDYGNAIEYLKKSIEEADNKEDLIVQKDATRRLSEVLTDVGDFDEALTVYKEYVELVDKLVIKKEQELSQAARFSKDITKKQNRITSLESDRALSESKYQLSIEQSKRQKLIIYSLIGGLLLLLITAFLMFKYIKQQRLANNLLALKSLRSQMNPHFIFNALNSVNSFIALNDERTANKYLTDFSLLMRAVLENSEEDFISLKKEIELLELYTKLEHFRFQDKFDYTINVDENINVDDFVIPPMLLQPYIENAVWHGLRYKKTKGILEISIAQSKAHEITITIADNGIGREKSKALKTTNQKKQNSKGMGNIKKRVAILNDMYKDKVDVFIEDFKTEDEDTGTKVIVTLKKD